MAFLKLRDQVGEGRRGGIAPAAEGGRKGGCGRAGGAGRLGTLLAGWLQGRLGAAPGDGRAAGDLGAAGNPPVSEARAG